MIYLDNAASTPPAPEVLARMTHAAATFFANPSSAHRLGAAAARALDEARAQVAGLLRAEPSEIIFTSGGTEADALGLLGAAGLARGHHAVVTAIEHPAVLRSAERLIQHGWQVTFVVPQPSGAVSAEDVVAALRPETSVVAVMLVNNELGTIQPVAPIAKALRLTARPPHLHVDAVQAAGFVPLAVKTLGADSVAISGHKMAGPKGVGALWLRPGARLAPLWDGGRQERGLRSGTENVPGCVGLGCAAELCRTWWKDAPRVAGLRDRLQQQIFAALPSARPTVTGAPQAPHIASIQVPDLPAEPILHALEARDVFASAGSACASRTRGPSHVLKAVGIDDEAAILRFSLSRHTTEADVDHAAVALVQAVAEIERMARSS